MASDPPVFLSQDMVAAATTRTRRGGDRVSAPGKAGAIQPVEDRPK